MKNIVLVGMMGCGKSTCGRILSHMLDMPLVDTDQLAETLAGRPIPEIFAEEGEAAFRAIETEAARQCTAKGDQIIATGGGLPLRGENRELIRENGIVFFLDRDPGITYDTSDLAYRPLAQQGRSDFIARYEQRAPLYRAAAHHIIGHTSSPKETVRQILKLLPEEYRNRA